MARHSQRKSKGVLTGSMVRTAISGYGAGTGTAASATSEESKESTSPTASSTSMTPSPVSSPEPQITMPMMPIEARQEQQPAPIDEPIVVVTLPSTRPGSRPVSPRQELVSFPDLSDEKDPEAAANNSTSAIYNGLAGGLSLLGGVANWLLSSSGSSAVPVVKRTTDVKSAGDDGLLDKVKAHKPKIALTSNRTGDVESDLETVRATAVNLSALIQDDYQPLQPLQPVRKGSR